MRIQAQAAAQRARAIENQTHVDEITQVGNSMAKRMLGEAIGHVTVAVTNVVFNVDHDYT